MRILIVEDEREISDLIRASFHDENWDVSAVVTAEEATRLTRRDKFDLYILDIMLPGQSGLDFCAWLRKTDQKDPILMLSARASLQEKVTGLESGADDYMTKPFELDEMVARVRALIRKSQGYPKEVTMVEDFRLDPNTRVFSWRDNVVNLTKMECRLIEFLMENSGQVLGRARIGAAVWDSETSIFSNVIDVLINHLRSKLETVFGVNLIHTSRGKGYQFGLEPISKEV